jgi:hypothetical protein
MIERESGPRNDASSSTMMLDLEYMCLEEAKCWAEKTMKKFRLSGYRLFESSERHYHVVFDRTVSWPENVSIVAWVCNELSLQPLTQWFLLQCIKKESTLRISAKGKKPSPKPIYREGITARNSKKALALQGIQAVASPPLQSEAESESVSRSC